MGKIKKHTEYYCDICGYKIGYKSFSSFCSSFYKIKCYDCEGKRYKKYDYNYICNDCMLSIVKKVSNERKGEKND